MNEQDLRRMITRVKDGRMSRRAFVQRMVALGLTAPLAGQMLASSGVAAAAPMYKPTKAGGGGTLKVLYWQGATLLNPHFAVGTKDQDASRIFYEPLAGWDAEGQLTPFLAAEVPTRENGGLSADGKSVTWKLKQGVKWHDGAPFTADDCIFNWEFANDPGTAAVTSGTYKDVKVEKIDSHTIKVIFEKPTPFWADPFVGTRGQLIPKHLFDKYRGDKSREAPTNLAPVGTGAYKFVSFAPGDLVKGERNPNYHLPNRPYFDAIEVKGGGDAVSAARAVLQTGEYDYAWNMQVEDEILKRLEAAGKGVVNIVDGGSIEHIQLNTRDPWTEVDGERSSLKTEHPALKDPAVKAAMAMLVDKESVQKHIYGRTGIATANFLNNPERYRSIRTKYEFNPDKAAKILEDAGWKKGSDGIREKGGVKLKFVYQTSINQPRQKNQAIVKQACQKAGIEIEIKAVTASVFFSSDVANPDTYTKFYSDIQMYTTTMPQPDPQVFMAQFTSWEAATKVNKWQGRNITRWQNADYDATYRASENELDPVKRAAMFVKMNELVIDNHVVIPVVSRPLVSASSKRLHPSLSGWDNTFWNLRDWWRDA
ncbi:MAG: peptide ABC transporter substrate-binding protein [Alphaproteobacteria bacterium]